MINCLLCFRFPLLALLLALPAANAQAHAGDATASASTRNPWWQGAVIYEVYPRSFQDSNGDGIGDLVGLISRLDYLQSLHVNAIWLTPIYPSPQVDFGYDISDYRKIDPMYGTMADFDRLVAEAKKRHIGILMDLVLNHTSDQHEWFKESRSSRTNPKADWYMWQDAKPDGGPPNNWVSLFGGSAWKWDPVRKQYYYHRFYTQQPDLNWRNPEVKKAMFDVCRFWLSRGVAGFRLDAVPAIFEDKQLRDAKLLGGTNAYGDPNMDQTYVKNLSEMHPLMKELRKLMDSYPGEHVLVGETDLPTEELRKWYGESHDELQLPMDMYLGMADKLDAELFRQRLAESEYQLGGNYPLLVFDNHDRRRSWDRYGNGRDDDKIARIFATLLLTARGTAMMYYGQELGMVTTPPRSIDEVQDPIGRTGWPRNKGRDGERTPMQWTPGTDAGFSTAQRPWLPLPASAQQKNVETESADPSSLLSWYKTLLDLRSSTPALLHGDMKMYTLAQGLVTYSRTDPSSGHQYLVLLNMSATEQTANLANVVPKNAKLHPLLQDFGLTGDRLAPTIIVGPFGSLVAEIVR